MATTTQFTSFGGCRGVPSKSGSPQKPSHQYGMPQVASPLANAPQAKPLGGRVAMGVPQSCQTHPLMQTQVSAALRKEVLAMRDEILAALPEVLRGAWSEFFFDGIDLKENSVDTALARLSKKTTPYSLIAKPYQVSEMIKYSKLAKKCKLLSKGMKKIDRSGKYYVWGSYRIDIALPKKMFKMHQECLKAGCRLNAWVGCGDKTKLVLFWIHPKRVKAHLSEKGLYDANIDNTIENMPEPQKKIFESLLNHAVMYLSLMPKGVDFLLIDGLDDRDETIDDHDKEKDFRSNQLKKSTVIRTITYRMLQYHIQKKGTSYFTKEVAEIWKS